MTKLGIVEIAAGAFRRARPIPCPGSKIALRFSVVGDMASGMEAGANEVE